ncbi:hypothetical protein BDZ97DRAFT_1307472 [Flammula alnicola]|nr:hypothetical protein BDZ97DRAFT_1307472 [Flammula alnicola]
MEVAFLIQIIPSASLGVSPSYHLVKESFPNLRQQERLVAHHHGRSWAAFLIDRNLHEACSSQAVVLSYQGWPPGAIFWPAMILGNFAIAQCVQSALPNIAGMLLLRTQLGLRCGLPTVDPSFKINFASSGTPRPTCCEIKFNQTMAPERARFVVSSAISNPPPLPTTRCIQILGIRWDTRRCPCHPVQEVTRNSALRLMQQERLLDNK